jgi:hypothetical protein
MPSFDGDKYSITQSDDGAVVSSEGDLTIGLDGVRKVSVDNIIRVQNYSLSNQGDFVIHRIEFPKGGYAILGYAKTGKLMRFETQGIMIRIRGGDHIILDFVDDHA